MNRQIFPPTSLITIYHHFSEFHSQITLYATPWNVFVGRQFLPGILGLGNPSISTFYVEMANVIDLK
jgi:hypothetical protein